MEAKLSVMPILSQQFLNSLDVKVVPLSVMMLCGTPKRITSKLMKFIAVVESYVVTGVPSIHLVNLSTATSV
jgi:hypothetical protein